MKSWKSCNAQAKREKRKKNFQSNKTEGDEVEKRGMIKRGRKNGEK